MDSKQSQNLTGQINEVILNNYNRILQTPESTLSKFILIAVGIEFLGACLDRQHMKATARGEKRFNLAIGKLFPKPYHHFIKTDAVPNLYHDFRCPVIHQFRAGKSVFLCSSQDQNEHQIRHLSYNTEGSLILIVEEFYEDLAVAAKEMIRILESGK